MKITVDAPAGFGFMNANQRTHRMAVAKATAAWRDHARVIGSGAGFQPVTGLVRVWCEVYKPVANRYDPGNLYPTAKACVDGFRDAGLLVDDDWRHVEGPHMVHGGKGPAALVFRFEALEPKNFSPNKFSLLQ